MEFLSLLFFVSAILVTYCLLNTLWSERNRKNQKNETQNFNNELQSVIDDMTPREFYTHKMSQTKLIWDPRTQAYLRKWSKNDTTFH